MNTTDALRSLLAHAEEETRTGDRSAISGEIRAALAMLKPGPNPSDPIEAWRRSFSAVCRRIARDANNDAGAFALRAHINVARELLDLRDRLNSPALLVTPEVSS